MKVYEFLQRVEECQTQADASSNVLTFSKNIEAIEIYHEEATWQEFIVNGITLTIPAGSYRSPIGGENSNTVTCPAAINYIVKRLE